MKRGIALTVAVLLLGGVVLVLTSPVPPKPEEPRGPREAGSLAAVVTSASGPGHEDGGESTGDFSPGGPTGSIVGRVFAVHAAPEPAIPIQRTGANYPYFDRYFPPCGPYHETGAVVVSSKDGALANAVVYLKGPKAPPGWPPAGGTYAIDQRACHFLPRVLLVPAGRAVTFSNGDSVLHEVKATSTANDSFAHGVPANGTLEHVFEKPEFVGLGCSLHPFMGGVVVVQAHPWYALTDEKGAFRLDGVPAGRRKLVCWHERLKQAQPDGVVVTVQAAATTEQDIHYR